MTNRDPFMPSSEPARSIYDAFQNEATKRKSRTVEEWILAERIAVFKAAQVAAELHGLRKPTQEEVDAGERYASGSIDYGAKWAYQVVNCMQSALPVQ